MKEIGIIGLGKMGLNLIKNIKKQGFEPIGFDVDASVGKKLASDNIKVTTTITDLLASLPTPRTVLLMLPSGEITNNMIDDLLTQLTPNDCLIDAGNSFYQDSVKSYHKAKAKEINFVDCGTSGGQEGALNGACLMVGGDQKVIAQLTDFFTKISVKNGFLHTGPAGSGHFCKMIHNGIEYGMMQAIAEGYELLNNSDFTYDLGAVSQVWNNGSVIRSWLIELLQDVFSKKPNLAAISDVVNMNGEGLWTVQEALQQGTPAPVITLSVQMRQISQQKESFAGKVLSLLRNAFGGHAITTQ